MGGAFGLPGGTLGMPGGIPGGAPGAAPAGLFSGPPGGITGPPGGVPPQPLADLTLLAPLPGALQAGALAPPPSATGRAGARTPAAPPAGAGAAPGGGVQLALPDIQGAARRALESVVARADPSARTAPPAGAAPPATGGHPAPAPYAPPAGARTPHVAPARVHWEALPPVPAPGSGTSPPARVAAGVWRGPPPRDWHPAPRPLPAPPPLERSGWPGAAIVPQQRDLAQRVGDRLYPIVERLRDSRLSWVAVVALFGITVPIILLRQSFDVRLRLGLAALTFLFWLGLIQDIG
jgi:hypothetical protein